MRFPLNVSRLVVPLLALLLTLLAAPVAAQTPCDGHAGRLADINTREQLKQVRSLRRRARRGGRLAAGCRRFRDQRLA